MLLAYNFCMNDALVAKIGDLLVAQGKTVTCAESCTGGGISYSLTSVSGSSRWFNEGYVSYSNAAKARIYDLNETTIRTAGVVSESVVKLMLAGVLKRSGADYGVAVSGIAGPDGAVPGKPVGTVCLAWGDSRHALAQTYLFRGDRTQVREQAITQSLLNLFQHIKAKNSTV